MGLDPFESTITVRCVADDGNRETSRPTDRTRAESERAELLTLPRPTRTAASTGPTPGRVWIA
jgi:hypothetical protein